MFTNKNKLIGFIALIVVVVLVASAAIALIADGSTKKALKDAQAKIDELNSALTGANADLDKAQKDLDDLKAQLANADKEIDGLDALVDKYQAILDSWTAANENHDVRKAIAKLSELRAKAEESLVFVDSAKVTELLDGRTLDEWYADSMYTIIRSADPYAGLTDFETLVNGLVENRADTTLDAMIEAVKEGGVTYDPDDKPGIDDCKEYLADHPVLQNTAKDYEGQIAELEAQYEAAKKAYYAAAFIAEVAKVDPAVDGNTYVTLDTDTTAVKAAWDALVAVCADEAEALALAGVQDAHDVWTADVEARLVQLADAKLAADDLNAQIAGVQVDATVATGDIIAKLKADVKAWGTTYKIVKTLEPLNWFVKDDEFDALDAAYAEKIAELEALYEKLLEALKDEKFVNINIDSVEAVENAEDAYEAVANYQDVEALLNLPVGTMQGHKDVIDDARAELEALLKRVNDLKDLIEKTYNAGFRATDLNDNLALIEAGLKALKDEGFDINVVVGEKHLGMVEVIRLYPAKYEADVVVMKAYNDAHATIKNDAEIAKLTAELDRLGAIISGNDLAAIEQLQDANYVAGLFAACLAAEK